MGKGKRQTVAGGLGRSIVKERKREVKGARGGESWLHTSEVEDVSDHQNVTSVTEQNSLDDFLSTAQLAGTVFTGERLNVKVVTPGCTVGMLTAEQVHNVQIAQEENKHFLHIPRRPGWNETTTGEQLQLHEREAFLDWRRQLARLEEVEHLNLTPFERNLEFWRQLWRVVERSDLVVQIVDARNPLLFRSGDLVKYVKEVGADKQNFLLMNKSDLLTDEQRDTWAAHFREHNIEAVFFSALEETDAKEEEEEEEEEDAGDSSDSSGTEDGEDEYDDDDDDVSTEKEEDEDGGTENEEGESEDDEMDVDEAAELESERQDESASTLVTGTSPLSTGAVSSSTEQCVDENTVSRHQVCAPAATAERPSVADSWQNGTFRTTGRLFSRSELVDLFKLFRLKGQDRIVVGLVGYPNVGKSSTINALLQYKKVPVSATPGRTKHFQTLLLDDELMLCDCPGLVFPQFVSTKAEMVCSGILPIDQMRDHDGPINFVCHQIPRVILQKAYGIMLPKPHEGEDPDRPPLPLELLMSYGYVRGFMTTKGVPDCPRAARIILKDFVKGRMLYCHPPPGVDAVEFQHHHRHLERLLLDEQKVKEKASGGAGKPIRIPKALKIIHGQSTATFDKGFFDDKQPRAISRGKHGRTMEYTRADGLAKPVGREQQQGEAAGQADDDFSDTASVISTASVLGTRPWKKHYNRGKKAKTRRLVDNDY